MQYGVAAEDDEDDHEVTNAKGAKGQVKGKGNMIITKEAIYLTTLATVSEQKLSSLDFYSTFNIQ